MYVEPHTDGVLFPEDMPGYLGMAYNFHVDGNFNTATISFTFDSAILDDGADPAIFYFNEEDQILEELETTIDGNVASAVVEHFSTYILIDRKIHYNAFTWDDVWTTESNYNNAEVVLVIDDSGSLGGDWEDDRSTGYFTGGTDPQHLRLSAARNFVDASSESAKIGIIKFDTNVELFANLTTCDNNGKSLLKSKLQFTPPNSDGPYNQAGVFDSRGQTYMYTGIEEAINMLNSKSSSTMKVVLVFTDGEAHDSSMHNAIINKAISQNVRIYTVGLGSSTYYFSDYLQPLAEATGGAFYMASEADQLNRIYEEISMRIDIETDSDKDGIPDYYEDHMVSFNGKKINLDKNNADTDGDGLKDGQEVVIVKTPNADGSKIRVHGKVLSYPDMTDSDKDGIKDYYDPDPLYFTITDRVLSWAEGLSYTNAEKYIGKTVDNAIKSGMKIDGISKDKTVEIIKEYMEKYSFIRLLFNHKKEIPYALNIFSISSSDLISPNLLKISFNSINLILPLRFISKYSTA